MTDLAAPRPRVLVVDDEAGLRDMVAEYLGKVLCDAEQAHGGQARLPALGVAEVGGDRH